MADPSVIIQRRLIVKEAESWLFTPFHWKQQIKGPGGGCDCGSFMKACFDLIGTNVELPQYTTQFFLHSTHELYLKALGQYCYAGHKFVEGDVCISSDIVNAQGPFPSSDREYYPSLCKRCGLEPSLHLENYDESHPQPGDIVTFKMGRAYGHAGIVIQWPTIIHSCAGDRQVTRARVDIHPLLMDRERLFFSIKAWHKNPS